MTIDWLNTLPLPEDGLKIMTDIVRGEVKKYTVGTFNFDCDCGMGVVHGTVYVEGVFKKLKGTGHPCDNPECTKTYTVEMEGIAK